MESFNFVVSCATCHNVTKEFESLRAAKKYARLLCSEYDKDDIQIVGFYDIKF